MEIRAGEVYQGAHKPVVAGCQRQVSRLSKTANGTITVRHPAIYLGSSSSLIVRWFWWQGPWIMNRLHVSLETDHPHHFLRALTTVDFASLMNGPNVTLEVAA